MSGSSTTITILDSRLLLVSIPRSLLNECMHAVVEATWHRPRGDKFFALCVNEVEASLFCEAQTVKRTFKSYFSDDDDDDDDHGLAKAMESAITITEDSSTDNMDERVVVGRDEWVALEFSFHGEGWQEAGQRVRDFSSPLADEGVSILFLSTYSSDYILVRVDKLDDVTSILEKSGFTFTPPSDDEDDGPIRSTPPRHPLKRTSTLSSRRSSDRGASLAGSLVLTDSDRSGPVGIMTSPPRRSTLSRTGSINESASSSSSRIRRTSSRHGSAGSSSRSPGPSALTRLITDEHDNDGTLSTQTFAERAAALLPESAVVLSPTSSGCLPLPPLKNDAFARGDPLSILSDELVVVGLAKDREALWRSKIVDAVFYARRVLDAPADEVHQPGLRQEREEDVRTGGPRLSSSLLSTPESLSMATASADEPVPFVAFTQTDEGSSLTADIRLLRRLFDESEEDMVYAVGNGGLRGEWDGERQVVDDDEDDDGDDQEEDDESDQDDQSAGTSNRGRTRTRTATPADSINTTSDHQTSRKTSNKSSAQRDDDSEAGRQILKCIQLDLTQYGLDKAGIVEWYAGVLLDGPMPIKFMYHSTVSTANLLVGKRQIKKARKALLEASRAAALSSASVAVVQQ